MTLFDSLRYPYFALLWTGQTISRFGDFLYRVALAWWVLEKTGSAAAMGTVFVFTSVPMLIFVLLGGVAVDRFPRARVMFLSDLGRGITVGLTTWLAFTNSLEIWHIYAISIFFGFVSAFFQPAYAAIIPDMVPVSDRSSANSLTALSGQLTGILGPAVGALIVATSGMGIVFGLDAISFFISAVCLLPLFFNLQAAPATPHVRTNALQEMREGIATVLQMRWLWIMLLAEGLVNLTQAGPYIVGLPFLVKSNLGNNVQALGWLYSTASVGSVAAAVWIGHYTKIHRRGISGFTFLTIWGAATAVLALPLGLPALLVANFMVGGSVAAFNLIEANLIQELVPADRLGRVYSISFLGSFVLLPIGFGMAGVLVDAFGAPRVLFVGGVLTALLALGGLLQSAVRKLD